jgi:hypothetical protein
MKRKPTIHISESGQFFKEGKPITQDAALVIFSDPGKAEYSQSAYLALSRILLSKSGQVSIPVIVK